MSDLYHEHDATVILEQVRMGNTVFSLMRLHDWPISISDSIYSEFFAVVKWTAYEKDRPNYYEKCSGETLGIIRGEKAALLFFHASHIFYFTR